MKSRTQDHYATLGLGRGCSDAEIRAAYRALAKRHHPDVNAGSADAVARTQALNAAFETLGDDAKRRAYDAELAQAERPPATRHTAAAINITQDVHLGILELLRGQSLTIRVNDPARTEGAETYQLDIPPGTAPGTRFRLKRDASAARGVVVVRVKVRPDFRFKARGSDLRCDLKISTQRATMGGTESLRGPTDTPLRVSIRPHVPRGEIVRIAGEGLPRPRGGRGDLLVRITYRPEVRITRSAC